MTTTATRIQQGMNNPQTKGNTMNIGDNVWNLYHGLLRFGRIEAKDRRLDGWTYFGVEWFEDAVYQDRVSWRCELAARDYTRYLYRADELHSIDFARLAKVAAQ